MYIQITTRCNMLCDHCCYSCTTDGIDMSVELFRKACKLAKERSEVIFLGGGEPTLHKDFELFIGIALLNNRSEMPIGVITNGTNKEITLGLLEAAYNNKIFCEVSLDHWHNLNIVDDKVKEIAKKYKLIRRIDEPMAAGRYSAYGIDSCCCHDFVIDPTGDIYPCGCKQTKIENIKNIDSLEDIEYELLTGECEYSLSDEIIKPYILKNEEQNAIT